MSENNKEPASASSPRSSMIPSSEDGPSVSSGLKRSLVALATQDANGDDFEAYDNLMRRVSQNKKEAVAAKNGPESDEDEDHKSTPKAKDEFGRALGTLIDTKKKSGGNEIQVDIFDSSDEDSVNRALKDIRQIPLDKYLDEDKVIEVKRQSDRRMAEQKRNAKVRNKHNRGSLDKTALAIGSQNPTDWSDMPEAQKKRRIQNLRKGLQGMQYEEMYQTRLRNYRYRRELGIPIDEQIKEKRSHLKRIQKRKRTGKSVGSEGAISCWSAQDPDHDILVDRKIQYESGIPRMRATSVDVQEIFEFSKAKQNNVSRVTQFDDRSVQMSAGMIVRKSKKMQTMTQYQLVPEVIYNSLEIKIRELMKQILTPTHNRQQIMEKEQQKQILQAHQFDAKLRDCQMGIKKQLAMTSEFDTIHTRMEAQNMQIRKLETDIANVQLDAQSKVEKNAANTRVLAADVKNLSKFINKKNDDTNRMQEIINSFKDRLMEKYAALSDEYTEQIKRLEHKQLNTTDQITKILRNIDGLTQENQAVKVENALMQKSITAIQEDVVGLKRCYKFEPRISTLENQAKSDLIAVTRKLNEILYENKRNLKRAEALKLIYSMQVEMGKAMVDPETHRCKEKATQEKPKLPPMIQSTVNLLDWQISLNQDGPFNEKNLLKVMNKFNNQAPTDIKAMKKEKFLLELNAQKIGRKVTRASSQIMRKLEVVKQKQDETKEELAPIELPQIKKKKVRFSFLAKQDGVQEKQEQGEQLPRGESQRKSLLKNAVKTDYITEKLDRIFEPQKLREVVCLNQLKRSRSWEWVTRVKPTLDNLYTDPTSVRLLDRLKTSLASSHSVVSGTMVQSRPRRSLDRQASKLKTQKKKSKPPKEKKEKKERKTASKQDHSFQQVTSSNVVASPRVTASSQNVAPPSRVMASPQRGASSNVVTQSVQPVVRQPPTQAVSTQNLPVRTAIGASSLMVIPDRDENSSRARAESIISQQPRGHTPVSQAPSQQNQKSGSKQSKRKKQESSSDSDAFSSEDDGPVEFGEAMYDEFMPRAELEEELELAKIDLKNDIFTSVRGIITEISSDLVTNQVGQAQIQIGEMLQDQLYESQESMKAFMKTEVEVMQRMAEKIEKHIIPSTIAKINSDLESQAKEQKQMMDDALREIRQSIAEFTDRIDFFATSMAATQKKFKRLVADQDIFKKRIEKIQQRTKEMVQVMRSEQLASSKVVSTLVELEFIQQSLDFQDEFDKTQMNLYGLNDLNMTLEEFLEKSNEIASRKIKHEAMQKAAELEGKLLGANSKFELTDSGTYQAITMGDDWASLVGNDHLSKQIHQAFKLACIYYKPSPVLYRGNSYNRRALIEAKRQMLDADWQMIQKFQPFKRLWGEDSGVDFYEQFNTKLQALIKAREHNTDMNQLSTALAEETFVKILSGTNIYDLKMNDNSRDEDLISSDGDVHDEHERMQAALKTTQQQMLNVSNSMNIAADATQSSIKLLNDSVETPQPVTKLLNSARPFEVISNKRSKKKRQDKIESIDSRTRSMLNAIQGKSIFGPSYEESIFSASEAEKPSNMSVSNIKSSSKGHQAKRMYNRSVQRSESKGKDLGNMFGDFLHSPFWANQSQALDQNNGNNYLGSESKRSDLKSNIKTQIKSSSRNQRVAMTLTENNTPVRQTKIYASDAPLVEMRPLIGKDQFRQSKFIGQEGDSLNEYDDMRRSRQQSTGYSAWNRTGQFGNKMRQADSKSGKVPTLDIQVIGSKQDHEKNPAVDEKAVRNLAESLQRSQLIKPTTLNFPLNLPIQTINMSSPKTNEIKPNSCGSQSAISLPQVHQKSSKLVSNQRYGNVNDLAPVQHPLNGQLGIPKQQSYTQLAQQSRFNSSERKKAHVKSNQGGPVQLEGVASTASLMWNAEDDLGSSMVAKLAHSPGSDPLIDNSAALLSTQKLKDIARQKKQMLVREENSSSAQ